MRFVLVQRTLSKVGLAVGLLLVGVGACAEPQSGHDVGDSTGRSVDTFTNADSTTGGGVSGTSAGGGGADGTQMVTAGAEELGSTSGESGGDAFEEEQGTTDEAVETSTATDDDEDDDETDTDSAEESGSTGDTDTEGGCLGMLSYRFVQVEEPTLEQQRAYLLIERAMDEAIELFNCNWDDAPNILLDVHYDPSATSITSEQIGMVLPTLRVGSASTFTHIRAVHELSHVFAAGGRYFNNEVVDGVFTGAGATATLRELTGDDEAVIHTDGFEFWPYGLQSDDEVQSDADLIAHIRIVAAIYSDLYADMIASDTSP